MRNRSLIMLLLVILSTTLVESQTYVKSKRDKESGLVGFIDEDKNYVITPRYDNVGFFRHSLSIVNINDSLGVVSREGKEVLPTQYQEIIVDSKGLIFARKNYLWGAYNAQGKEVFAHEYRQPFKFNPQGLSIVSNQKAEYGIVRYDGTNAYPIGASFIREEQQLFIIANREGKWAIYDQQLMPLSTFYDKMQVQEMDYIKEDVLLVSRSGKWGVIRTDGSEVIEPIFDEVDKMGFKLKLCAVRKGNFWNYIRPDGTTITKFNLTNAPTMKLGIYMQPQAQVTIDGIDYILLGNGDLKVIEKK